VEFPLRKLLTTDFSLPLFLRTNGGTAAHVEPISPVCATRRLPFNHRPFSTSVGDSSVFDFRLISFDRLFPPISLSFCPPDQLDGSFASVADPFILPRIPCEGILLREDSLVKADSFGRSYFTIPRHKTFSASVAVWDLLVSGSNSLVIPWALFPLCFCASPPLVFKKLAPRECPDIREVCRLSSSREKFFLLSYDFSLNFLVCPPSNFFRLYATFRDLR